MGRHNTIAGRKAAQDSKRAAVFTKYARLITVAAKAGGDPDYNPSLRTAIDKAKAAGLPNDNITRAIKKGTGELEGESYEELTFEGYGAGGVAIFIEAATDNRNRTAADVRHLFDKFNGSLGTSGSVTYMFDYKGVVIVVKNDKATEDAVMMTALDSGADDVINDEDCFEVVCKPELIHAVGKAFEEGGYEITSSEVQYVPQNTLTLDRDRAISINKLIVALDDLDDVQNVYSNADLSVLDEEE